MVYIKPDMDSDTESVELMPSTGENEVLPSNQKVYFLKPESRVARTGRRCGQRYLVPIYKIPEALWMIHDVWIKCPKRDFIALFCASELVLSRVSVTGNRAGFVKIPFFDSPFPHHMISFQECRIEILRVVGISPLYLTYKKVGCHAKKTATMELKNGARLRFCDGRVDFPTYPLSPLEPEIQEKTKSYSDALEDLGQLMCKGHLPTRQIEIEPLEAPNYVKALTDLGFDNYTVRAQPGDKTYIAIDLE